MSSLLSLECWGYSYFLQPKFSNGFAWFTGLRKRVTFYCHMKVHAPGEYCFCSGPVICMDRWFVFQEDLALGSLHKLCEEVAMVRACRASQETTHNLYWHHLQNPVPKFSATECDTQAGDFSYGEFYMITMARSPLCVVSPDSSVSSGGLFSSV